MSVVSGAKARLRAVRERRPFIDHVVRMVEHYGKVNGSALAAAVTYFAFLSFFPILALSFAIFGQVTKVYKSAQDTLVDAANSVLPGLVGPPDGVPLDTLQSAAPGIFSVGILLTLYSGLGWLSGMREALELYRDEKGSAITGFLIEQQSSNVYKYIQYEDSKIISQKEALSLESLKESILKIQQN